MSEEGLAKKKRAEDAYSQIRESAERRSPAKKKADAVVRAFFLFLTVLASSVVFVVIFYILAKGVTPFFKRYSESGDDGKASFAYFLSGLRFQNRFNPQTGKFEYGAFFLVVNTLIINLYVVVLAVPLSVLTALFIARIAPKPLAKIIQSGVDLLAAIPSVIYGIFGVGVIVPILGRIGQAMGLGTVSGVSLLAGAIILSLMALPTICSVSVTALQSVDEGRIQGSLALGASKTQTNFKIALRDAKSGIFAGIILGIGRSLGEATAVSMVAGSPTYGITWNPLRPTVTLSSQMLLSIGEAVPGSLNYDVRFSAGIMLMLFIVLFNLILNDVKEHISAVEPKPLFAVKLAKGIAKAFRKGGKHGKEQ